MPFTEKKAERNRPRTRRSRGCCRGPGFAPGPTGGAAGYKIGDNL